MAATREATDRQRDAWFAGARRAADLAVGRGWWSAAAAEKWIATLTASDEPTRTAMANAFANRVVTRAAAERINVDEKAAWAARGREATVAVALCPNIFETAEQTATRRARWVAAALRRAYDLSWAPASLVVNIAAVDVDREHQAVILTLRSGTRLVDTQDRIDVVGTTDDVTIDELVAAVRRRGWDAVELYGDAAFRRAAALRMHILEPPIAVADSPLTEADLAQIARRKAAMAAVPPVPDGVADFPKGRIP